MAEYCNIIKDFVRAEQYLISYQFVSGRNYKRGQGHFLLELSRTLSSLKRYEEALIPATQALELGVCNNHVETMMYANFHLSNANEHLCRFEAALGFYKKYHGLHMQFSGEKTQQRARLAEVRYETKKLKALLDTEAKRAEDIAHSYQELQLRTEMLAEAANLDPLTGLYNRRRMEAVLTEFDTTLHPYAIAMIDVDHFKKINDTFSHMIGDQVLRQISTIINLTAGTTDMAVRYGGEEFALLMSGAGITSARQMCELIRGAIATWDWDNIASELAVTVSVGMAGSTEMTGSRAILQLADRRLYAAKKGGRNRVVIEDAFA
jgi:diguanylate cyclase (GGDEF)-like protein